MSSLMEQWWHLAGAPSETWLRLTQRSLDCAQRLARMHADALTACTLKQAQDVDELLHQSGNAHLLQAWQCFWMSRAAEAGEYARSTIHTLADAQAEMAGLVRDQYAARTPEAPPQGADAEGGEALSMEVKPVPKKAVRAERAGMSGSPRRALASGE
jgi:hypothetical protein